MMRKRCTGIYPAALEALHPTKSQGPLDNIPDLHAPYAIRVIHFELFSLAASCAGEQRFP